jgi:hypothetical protein
MKPFEKSAVDRGLKFIKEVKQYCYWLVALVRVLFLQHS